MPYRRNAFTWSAFGALFAFGYVNAVLGPSLPFIRSTEGISYVLGAGHQVAAAAGGGLAGLITQRNRPALARRSVIAGGLTGAGLAAIALGYGGIVAITIPAALLMGFFATLALIRVWAALADAHGARRAVAMSEGEVAVSLAGIVTPLVFGALAGSAVSWRFAFAIGALTVAGSVLIVLRTEFPPPGRPDQPPPPSRLPRARLKPTLVIVVAIVALEFALSFWLASYLNTSVGLVRTTAVALVSVLYAANLIGRVAASRLARVQSPEWVLVVALIVVGCGLPFLLAATSTGAAILGIVLTGIGIGALFPLTSSVHVQATGGSADTALGEILSVAAVGQMGGPLLAGVLAQAVSLRVGLQVILPSLVVLAAFGLAAHQRRWMILTRPVRDRS